MAAGGREGDPLQPVTPVTGKLLTMMELLATLRQTTKSNWGAEWSHCCAKVCVAG